MKIFSHCGWIIFRIVCIAVLLPAVVHARVELRSVAADRNTVSLAFSALPRNVSAELSADKTRIVLTLPDAVAPEQAREPVKPTTVVAQVSVQQKGSSVLVYIDLRSRGGFSQLLLPYSQTLRLYVVDWTTLSPRDNLYHSGLLSLDSRVVSTAREYFARAASAGVGDAAAVAGLSLIAEGSIDEAERELRRAGDLGTSIPDVYAALADIAQYRNDTLRAQRSMEQFRRMSGLQTFASLLGSLPRPQSVPSEPPTIAQSLLTDEPAAGVADSTAADTARTDSSLNAAVSDRARALLADTTAAARQTPYTPGESLVPSWMKWTVFGFLFFVCVGLAGLVYLYLRWRKRQIAGQTPAAPQQTAFEQEVHTALQSVQARRAADLYSRSAGDETPAEQPAAAAEHEPPTVEHPQEQLSAVPQRHWMDDIDTTPGVQPAPAVVEPPQAHASDDVDALARKLRKGRGELELAVKLLARKKQDGKEKATTLDPSGIPDRPHQIARLAQSLGVGTGELEIRRNLAAADDDKTEKMRSLFAQERRGNTK